jgi:NADH:ubiquinone oxidoreductase subunit 2 (subunit N)
MNTKNISSVLFGVCFLVLTCFYYYRTIRILIEKPRTTVSEMKTWIKYVVIVSLILSIIFLLIPIYMIVSHDYFGFGSSVLFQGFFVWPSYFILDHYKKASSY